ncbi:hypothetical protein Bca101_044939 [Brassica carinata]
MDFHGMKRRKLQILCKKHGIPANLKNIEMANRLSTLFQDQTSPVRSQTMSDIPSGCSVTESPRDGASVDDDESLVLNKTDETLVTSEYNTAEEEEMPTDMELLLSVNRHGDLSEYNTHESSSAEKHADICKVGRLNACHCVRETLDGVLDESAVFTTPERNLMMMEQLSHNGKTRAAESVNHQSVEALESYGVVFTTPEQVLLLGDCGLDEKGKEEEHTATKSPEGVSVVVDLHDESNMSASSLSQSCVGDFNGNEIERFVENKTVELHCESGTITSPNRHALLGSFVSGNSGGNKAKDLHEDSFVNQEREEMELKDESALFTRFESCLFLGESTQDIPGSGKPGSSHHDSSAKVIMKDDIVVRGSHISALDLGDNTIADSSGNSIISEVSEETAGADFMQKGSRAENVAGLNATQGTSKNSKVNSPHVDLGADIEEADTIMECNPKIFVETTSSLSLPTGPILVKETVSTLTTEEDTEANEESVLKEHRFEAELAQAEVLENSAVHLTLSVNSSASSILDESAVFTTPERNLMMMEQLSQKEKTLAADSVNHHNDEAVESPGVVFTTPEQVLLLGDSALDEVGKQVDCYNITGASVTTKSHDMSDLLAASESPSIMGDFEPFTAKKQEREKVEFKDESALFTRFETRLLLGESGSSHHDSSAKVILKDDSMVRGSHVPALDLGDNTVAGSGCSITSKVFYSHEFNVGEETAGADFISKGSQAEHVDSANLFDLGIEGADTTMDAERSVSFSGHVLAGTRSLVPACLPEESSPPTNIHDQINDAIGELAITDDLIQTKATTQRDDMLDSSGGSSVFGKIYAS